jgi:exodeoxyribonuclease V alpha subunit
MIKGIGPVMAERIVAHFRTFHRAERSLASGLLDLLHAGHDRMATFQQVDWDQALTWRRNRWRRRGWR